MKTYVQFIKCFYGHLLICALFFNLLLHLWLQEYIPQFTGINSTEYKEDLHLQDDGIENVFVFPLPHTPANNGHNI